MKRIMTIHISVITYGPQYASRPDETFSSVDFHLAEGDESEERVRTVYNVTPIDMNGLLELQKRMLQGKKVYLTPELAAALGIEP